MHILRAPDYHLMPWKNGGGSTTEIAIYPEASSVSGVPFLWRVSIAEVTVNGPFSSFPGYDRHIMVIEGEGMRLDAGRLHAEMKLDAFARKHLLHRLR